MSAKPEWSSILPYIITVIAIFFIAFWCGKCAIHIAAIIYGQYRLHRKWPEQPEETPPGVSIIKPLLGVDPNIKENLETFFTLNYYEYEILFCIKDKNDPSITVVEELIVKYPLVNTTVYLGGSNIGPNPKINNMQPGYLASKYPLILISDSNIKMKEDSLLEMVKFMTDKVGLVHQLPFTCDREGFAASVEKIYFGTLIARYYLVADMFGLNCQSGMSVLIRKTLIDDVGGIEAFSSYLAEDYFFAKSLSERGWKIKICNLPALQNSGICDIHTFHDRLQRWMKLRFAMLPHMILLEMLSECFVLGLCTSWSVKCLFRWDPIAFVLVHILVWLFFDWTLLCVVQNGSLPFGKYEFLITWLFREISCLHLYVYSLWKPTIMWKSQRYKIKWGGTAEALAPE